MTRKMTRLLTVMLAAVLTIAAGLTSAAASAPAGAAKLTATSKVTSIAVSNLPAKTLTLKKGKSKTLKVKIVTAKASTSKKFTVVSSNEKRVTAKVSGSSVKVKAIKAGSAKLTITSKADTKKKIVIKVTVGTPVTKVALNKKTSKIHVGKKVTLKATVTPTKASNKKVVWTSSNTAIAKVSSAGAVSGVAAGTAKITATAADGSGKSAFCTVTVLANETTEAEEGTETETEAADTEKTEKTTTKIGIAAMEILSENGLKVTLTGAKKLSASDFVVKTKMYEEGAFTRQLEIEEVNTEDQINYVIGFALDDGLSNGETVQVTAEKLEGTNSITGKYLHDANKTYTFDSVINWSDEVSRWDIVSGGYGAQTVTGIQGTLPNGINLKTAGGQNFLVGTPSETGVFPVTFTLADELGNISISSVVILVGSEETIAAAAKPVYGIMDKDGYAVNIPIEVAGPAAATYDYSIPGEDYGLSIVGGRLTGTLSLEGTYTVMVTVTNQADAEMTASTEVVIHVAQGVTVVGIVTDANGTVIMDPEITFENTQNNVRYTDVTFTTNANGVYTAVVYPGVYDVTVQKGNGVAYNFRANCTDTLNPMSFKLNVYKVLLSSEGEDASLVPSFEEGNVDWYLANTYDKTGQLRHVGNGAYVYLKAGTYTLTGTGANDAVSKYTAQAEVSVTENISASAEVKAVEMAPAAP